MWTNLNHSAEPVTTCMDARRVKAEVPIGPGSLCTVKVVKQMQVDIFRVYFSNFLGSTKYITR